MTREELKSADTESLISALRYCGRDSYYDYATYYDEVVDEITQRLEQIEELEQENAELKEANRVLIEAKGIDDDIDWKALADKAEVTKQLTEAKELLNEFMRISKASDEDFEHYYSELIGKAEQFLKEVEK